MIAIFGGDASDRNRFGGTEGEGEKGEGGDRDRGGEIKREKKDLCTK